MTSCTLQMPVSWLELLLIDQMWDSMLCYKYSNLRSWARSNQFLALAFIVTIVEKMASQRYVVANGIRTHCSVWENWTPTTGFGQKVARSDSWKSAFRVLSSCRSRNSAFTVTSLSLMTPSSMEKGLAIHLFVSQLSRSGKYSPIHWWILLWRVSAAWYQLRKNISPRSPQAALSIGKTLKQSCNLHRKLATLSCADRMFTAFPCSARFGRLISRK